MNIRTLENIMEITNLFGYYNTSGKFKECTSTISYFDQLKDVIESWADEFEDDFNKEDEYLVEIAVFAERKFSEMGWLNQEASKELEYQLAKIDLGFATLVVEKSVDPTFPEEVYICLEEKDTGLVLQDIVTVGRKYHFDEGDSPVFEDSLCVKVWADKDSEDYTHSFEIEPYEQGCIQENDIDSLHDAHHAIDTTRFCRHCSTLVDLEECKTDQYWTNDGDRVVYHVCPECGEPIETIYFD